jgi:hypothetical protein
MWRTMGVAILLASCAVVAPEGESAIARQSAKARKSAKHVVRVGRTLGGGADLFSANFDFLYFLGPD